MGMGALGVGYLVRKLGNRSKPLVTLSQEGKEWTMKSESLVKTTETTFEMDKQFEEVTADDTVYQKMLGTSGGKDSFCTREFMTEKMKCVCTVDDIVTTRWYARK